MRKEFPKLYQKTATGALQGWFIEVELINQPVQCALIKTSWGQEGGKPLMTQETITEGKNIGRSNETTPLQQAISEADSRWHKKVEREGYVQDPRRAQAGETDQEGGIPPMLAKTYEDVAKKWSWPCDASRKYNGNRLLSIIQDGEVSLWSRKQTEITGIPHIKAELERAFAGREGLYILDGEIWTPGWSLQKISGFFRKQGTKPGFEELQYHIYDIAHDLEMPWQKRREELASYFATFLKGEHLIPVETVTVNNEQEARAAQMRWVAEGFEGAILRKYSTPYESGKRSGGLIKLKSFQDAEFEILAVNEGRGKFAGKAIFSCKAGNGKVFDCCAPGTMEDRAEYFRQGDALIGKQLTVKYFELSEDGTPLFPVGLALRDYGG